MLLDHDHEVLMSNAEVGRLLKRLEVPRTRDKDGSRYNVGDIRHRIKNSRAHHTV